MTKSQVIAILGKPKTAEFRDGTETLIYNLSESRFAEAAFGGVMRPANIGKNHYRVEFQGGKVVQYYQDLERR